MRSGGKGAAILTAAWIELQKTQIEEAVFYRGPDPDIKEPTFYGLFYADGRPKKIALAFSLWSKMAGYAHGLTADADHPALWALSGQNEAGDAALLLANTGDTPIRVNIVFTRRDSAGPVSVYKIDDASDEVQLSTLDTPEFEMSAYSVYFLIFK